MKAYPAPAHIDPKFLDNCVSTGTAIKISNVILSIRKATEADLDLPVLKISSIMLRNPFEVMLDSLKFPLVLTKKREPVYVLDQVSSETPITETRYGIKSYTGKQGREELEILSVSQTPKYIYDRFALYIKQIAQGELESQPIRVTRSCSLSGQEIVAELVATKYAKEGTPVITMKNARPRFYQIVKFVDCTDSQVIIDGGSNIGAVLLRRHAIRSSVTDDLLLVFKESLLKQGDTVSKDQPTALQEDQLAILSRKTDAYFNTLVNMLSSLAK